MLDGAEDGLSCAAPDCGLKCPVMDGIPILINPEQSLFSAQEILASRRSAGPDRPVHAARRLLQHLPALSANPRATERYQALLALLAQQPQPKVLVIGSGTLGAGMHILAESPAVQLIETDVRITPRTQLVCDAHDLPFESGSIDGVVLQAVLDDLTDPPRCIEEIHRVLRGGGLVYAETPFLFPVHDGWHDFTRYTHMGHRLLFRRFDEIASGAVAGPGVAMALIYRALLCSLVQGKAARYAMTVMAHVTGFWLKYLDRLIVDGRAAIDAPSGVYFMGKKSDRAPSLRDLVRQYRGVQHRFD
jgi:SAM-dependent methyltransferase